MDRFEFTIPPRTIRGKTCEIHFSFDFARGKVLIQKKIGAIEFNCGEHNNIYDALIANKLLRHSQVIFACITPEQLAQLKQENARLGVFPDLSQLTDRCNHCVV